MNLTLETEFDGISQTDFNLIVNFKNPDVWVSAFASDVRYTDSADRAVFAIGTPADNQRLHDLLSRAELRNTPVRISISPDLELIMEFVDLGFTLAALPEWEDESWSVRFERPVLENVTMILCSSKGRLEQYGPAK